MWVSNSTVAPCQHLSLLLIVSAASVWNAGLKVPVLRSQRDCKDTEPEDRHGSVQLASFCLFEKQKCFTDVGPWRRSVDLTVAGDDRRSAGGTVGAEFPFTPFHNWLIKIGGCRRAGWGQQGERSAPVWVRASTLLYPLYSDRASL